MPSIQIDISAETARSLSELAERCTAADQERSGATTHGPLTAKALLAMLAEEAALAIDRPGSWEGANMATVLESHGYQF
ncbi:hypothetical protein [Acidocella facilis]|uniref:hypothetical protein n=1 Tax=Acidocella facilis TaxID=525 RepID=UPI001F2629B1|nr:hypothetical protein [Acidocella facilis]